LSIVDFNSSIWTDPWFRKLPFAAKGLFIYVWTNNHKNLAGLYPLDVDTMAFETGIPAEEVPKLLKHLYPKVKYDSQHNIVFVVNHVKHQFMRTEKISMKVEIGIAKCPRVLPERHPFIGEFLQKYHTLSIEYPYPIQNAGYPSSGGEGAGEGKDAGKGADGDGGRKGNSFYSEECISPEASEIWREEIRDTNEENKKKKAAHRM
jgi:hypothetical protein